MVIKTTKGYYEIIKNVREAFNLEDFQRKYFEEFFDSYQYIVGDIASNTLRMKGFNTNPDNDNYYKNIPDYLCESCAYRGAYFILRRINENEYNSLYEKYKRNPNKYITIGEEKSFTMEKIPYDKDSLELESSSYNKPHIVFDMDRINKVKTYELPNDLKEDPKTVKQINNKQNNNSLKNNNNINNNFKNQNSFNNMNNKKSFSNGNKNKAFSNNKKK